MENNEFDNLIKNSLMDEDHLIPEEALVENTKNLIQKKRKHYLWINKIFTLCLSFICLLFSIKAISLSIQSENMIIINSLLLCFASVIILNLIYRHEIITFLKIKGE